MKSLKDIKEEYTIDTNEFSKVVLIASFALLIVSLHSAYMFQQSAEDIEKLDSSLDRTSAVISSDGFQESLEALQSIEGTEIGVQFEQARNAFSRVEGDINQTENSLKRLEGNYETYQWLVLVSIMGVVSGLSLRYLI